jgi:DNA-binding MarR family transcriptional regulator
VKPRAQPDFSGTFGPREMPTKKRSAPVARPRPKRARVAAPREAAPTAHARSDERPLGKTLAFMQQLWQLTHALDAMSKHMESIHGVTGPQRLALRLVGRSPGISAGELAEALRLHPSTVTGIVRRLVDRAFLARRPDPKDARRALLTLLPAGEQLDGQRTHTVEAAVRRAMQHASPAKLAGAQAVITAVIAELERETEASAPHAPRARRTPKGGE